MDRFYTLIAYCVLVYTHPKIQDKDSRFNATEIKTMKKCEELIIVCVVVAVVIDHLNLEKYYYLDFVIKHLDRSTPFKNGKYMF